MVDGATHGTEGFFDIRIAFAVKHKTFNFHLIALAMHNRSHTASVNAELVIDVLQSIFGASVLLKLMAITCDGASTMLGRPNGFAVRIRETCIAAGGIGVTAL
jgi:hypothetical protein